MTPDIQDQPTPKHPIVMLIDDSSIDNFVNKKIIERYGFAAEVLAFTRARHALKHLLQLKNAADDQIPSIIFLDLNMPEIDGYEFLETFNLLSATIKKHIRIVILTSSINPTDVEKCANYSSVVTFLHKPLVKNNLDALDLLLTEGRHEVYSAIGA